MPTDLPIHRTAPAASTQAGNRFFMGAVAAMLAISALLLLLPGGVQPS